MSRSFSAEFKLAAACCRWPPSPERDALVRSLPPAADPDAFLGLLNRHRVAALAHRALQAAGVTLPGISSYLADHATEVIRKNLIFAAESNRIQTALADAGLAFLFVKGVTLNLLAYGSLGLKQAGDIDLLVEPGDYRQACRVLDGLSYRCEIPGANSCDDLASWASKFKDTIWRHPGKHVVVELHERLTANPQLLASITARSPHQLVEVAPSIALPTLGREDLLVYLCVHGTFSGWYRLKWIADLNALLQAEDAAGRERLFERAVALRVERPVACGLLLCCALFGLELEPALAARLRRSFAVRQLVNVALRALVLGHAREITSRRLGTALIHASNLLLRPGFRYKMGDISQKGGRLILQRGRRVAKADTP